MRPLPAGRSVRLLRWPFADVEILADGSGMLLGVEVYPPGSRPEPSASCGSESVERARAALEAYFENPQSLDCRDWTDEPCLARGSAFEQRIWRALAGIPCGATETYGELAARVGSPGGARAAGHAARTNPLAILLPCHRVVGASGLVGYHGRTDGPFVEVKRALLQREAEQTIRWWF